MGMRGVNINSDPQLHGMQDLSGDYWTPLWELCSDKGLPVNFHIGASDSTMSWYGESPWPSLATGGEAGRRRHDDVHQQRQGHPQPDHLGAPRALPEAELRLGGERPRLDPVHPGDARLLPRGERRASSRQAVDVAHRVLPAADLRVVLVRRPGRRLRRSDGWASTTSCSRPTSRTRSASIRGRWSRCASVSPT